MTKTEFEKLLIEEGFVCEQGAQYPSVIVYESKDVKSVSKKVRDLCKKCGYNSSFAVRSYREGINVYPKNTEADVINIESTEQQEEAPAV